MRITSGDRRKARAVAMDVNEYLLYQGVANLIMQEVDFYHEVKDLSQFKDRAALHQRIMEIIIENTAIKE